MLKPSVCTQILIILVTQGCDTFYNLMANKCFNLQDFPKPVLDNHHHMLQVVETYNLKCV